MKLLAKIHEQECHARLHGSRLSASCQSLYMPSKGKAEYLRQPSQGLDSINTDTGSRQNQVCLVANP